MNNNVYILDDRAILYINGDDAKNFLQNLISNDINKVSDNSSCFASLFTPQGKFLYELIVVKHKLGFFIDCEKSQSEEIFKQLNLYKLRSKIENKIGRDGPYLYYRNYIQKGPFLKELIGRSATENPVTSS